MSERFISAVALYGPKGDPVRTLLAGIQGTVAEYCGDRFRPYSLDQIHATLIALNGVPGPESGTIVNEYYLEHMNARAEMDLALAMRILATHFAHPMAIRFGGYGMGAAVPFQSRGQHLFERAFSVRGNAFLLIGWPTGAGRPLDRLRRDMNAAHVLHRYHRQEGDVDDDFYLVVGHHDGAPAGVLDRAVTEVRDGLAAHPVDLDVGIHDVKIVAADSRTLAPPVFVGDLPVDAGTLLGLMRQCRLEVARRADRALDHGGAFQQVPPVRPLGRENYPIPSRYRQRGPVPRGGKGPPGRKGSGSRRPIFQKVLKFRTATSADPYIADECWQKSQCPRLPPQTDDLPQQ